VSSSGGVPPEGFALTGRAGERCEPDPGVPAAEGWVVLYVVVKMSLHRSRSTQQNLIMLLGRRRSRVACQPIGCAVKVTE
jgi:hypothetical protein